MGALFASLLVALLVALLVMADRLSRPASRSIGPPPPGLGAKAVSLPVGPSGRVEGWFTPGLRGQGAVLLLHGVRSDRTQMLGRARFLRDAGYATLLIDLPAHGESTGPRITFGAHESAGVRAAVEFLHREMPGEAVGVIGVSLGAASTVLAGPGLQVQAVVLESMYATINDAVENRLTMRLGPAAALLAQPLLWQLPLRTGVSAAALRPLAQVARLGAPVFIVSGAEDRHTPWHETQRIFEAAAPPKALWSIEGAAHVDLHAFAPAPYEARVLQFLAQHLRRGSRPEAHESPGG